MYVLCKKKYIYYFLSFMFYFVKQFIFFFNKKFKKKHHGQSKIRLKNDRNSKRKNFSKTLFTFLFNYYIAWELQLDRHHKHLHLHRIHFDKHACKNWNILPIQYSLINFRMKPFENIIIKLVIHNTWAKFFLYLLHIIMVCIKITV